MPEQKLNIVNHDADGTLLCVVGNSASHSRDTAGANSVQIGVTADAQPLDGNIVVDTVFTLSRGMCSFGAAL